MLPRILCRSAGFLKRTRGQQDLILISGIGRSCLEPAAVPSISQLRYLSTKNNGSEKRSSVHHDGMKIAAPDISKETSIDASSVPSSGEVSNLSAPSATPDATTSGSAFAQYYDKAFRLWTENSGTNEILALKESVNEAGLAFDQASATVTKSRRTLETALRDWERASAQHLQLLQRRESWTPEDAQRFADYVSLEITSRNELEQARHDLGRSEEILTKSQLDYINKMRRRYHEEQIWQDQWRVLGTYGTWSLIVLNSVVFLGSQFFQRRRERERMETIERLIRENRSKTISIEPPTVLVDSTEHEAPEGKGATENTTKVERGTMSAASEKDETEEFTSSTAIEEPAETVPSVPRTKMMDVRKNDIQQGESSTSDKETTTSVRGSTNSDESPAVNEQTTNSVESNQSDQEPKHRGVKEFGASAVATAKRWEGTLRSKTKALAGSVHQRWHDGISNSVSDIHVPSAVIGASVGGVAALTISVLLSSFSNRK